MTATIRGISSMATRQVLAELAAAYEQRSGCVVGIESVGGVDAAKRVQAGEPFDVVVLASDAIDKLIAAGRVVAGKQGRPGSFGVAIAVQAAAHRARYRLRSRVAASRAVSAARIGYSTGPSGVALAKLFERWGIADEIKPRIVQAPPGVPVGTLVARGEVELGFQQLSELMHLEGIDVIGPMPAADPDHHHILRRPSAPPRPRPRPCAQLLAFMASPEAADAKRRHGMEPA